jgi:diguanylate cyclase (GGDEF)-like protein
MVSDGVIVAANPEVIDTTGIPMGRLIGVPIAEFLVSESQPAWDELVRLAAPTPRSAAVRLVRGLAPVELTARLLPDGVMMVGLRSMAREHYYSALAKAELTHDQVTSLPNRYHLLAQLQDRLDSSPRCALSLVGLWIDELPRLVSERGEPAVEQVVKEVGNRLQGRLRTPDLLGRFDSAGFLTVLASDAPVAQLTTIASRLRDEVAFPVQLDDELVSFTTTVAVAALGPRNPTIDNIASKLDEVSRQAVKGGHSTEILDL